MSLIAWYPLNGNLNNQGIKNIELSSQGNISLNNNGKFGKCYYFDGVDDILYNNTVDLSEQCSLSVWFNPSRITSTTQWIVRLGAYAMGEVQLGFYINTSGINFSGLSEKNYNISLSINTWYHLVMTLDRNKIKGYLNGELVVDFDSNISKYSILTIGGRFDGNSTNLNYLFQGKINNIKIYDHCLSQEEVLQDYKQPMLHYSFENPYVEPTINLCNTFIKDTAYGTTYGTDSIGDYFIKVKSSEDRAWSGGVSIGSNTVYGGNYYTWSLEINPEVDIPATTAFHFDRNIFPTSTWVGNDAGCEIIDDYKGAIPKNTWTRVWLTVYISPEIGKATLKHRCCPAIPSGLTQYKCYYRNSVLEKKNHMTPYTSSIREAGLIRDNSGMGNDGKIVYQREEIPIVKVTPTSAQSLVAVVGDNSYTITGFNGTTNQCLDFGKMNYNSKYHYLNCICSYELDIKLENVTLVSGQTPKIIIQGVTYFNDGTSSWWEGPVQAINLSSRTNNCTNGTYHICAERKVIYSQSVTNVNYYRVGLRFDYIKSGTITISNLHAYYQSLDTSTLSLSDNSAIGTHSAYFNGKNRINCGVATPDEMDELTLSCWIYQNDWTNTNFLNGRQGSIVGTNFNIANVGSGGFGFKVENGTNTLNLCVKHTDQNWSADCLFNYTTLSPGWHLFTGIATKNKKQIYVDGELKKEVTHNNGNPIINHADSYKAPFSIGGEICITDPTNNLVDVHVDDVRLYATALSDEDIKALYNVKTKIDNKSNLYCNQLVETKSKNMMKPLSKVDLDNDLTKFYSSGTFSYKDGIIKYIISNPIQGQDARPGMYIKNSCYGGRLVDNKRYKYSFWVRVSKKGTYFLGEERIPYVTKSLESGKWYYIEREGLATGVNANFVIYNDSKNSASGDTIEIRDVQIYRLYDNENYNPGPNIKGQYKTFELNETFNEDVENSGATIVDKYGAEWLEVFYHDNNNCKVFFDSQTEALHTNSQYKFSILDQLEKFRSNDGKFEFLLEYPTDIPGKYNRWKQTDNPVKVTANNTYASGYEAIHVDWPDNNWGGLLRDTNSNSTLLKGSIVNTNNWFFAIGAIKAWGSSYNGVPGPYPGASGYSNPNGIVHDIHLYVRIDNLPNKNEIFRQYKRQTKTKEIIEI